MKALNAGGKHNLLLCDIVIVPAGTSTCYDSQVKCLLHYA